jgi:hypothetical protein
MPMPRTVYIILATIAVSGVTAASWRMWQLWRVHSFYEEARKSRGRDKPLQPSTRHLQAIRQLRFAWDPLIESGAPMVDPFAPYGSADIRDDLGPIIGTRNSLAVARFHSEISRSLIWALKNGELPEGRYRIAHLDNASLENTLLRMAGGIGNRPPGWVARLRANIPKLDDDGTFLVTTEHRLLLKRLNLEWPPGWMRAVPGQSSHPVPIVDCKRPFGDATDFEYDMASILGLPAPQTDAEPDPALWRLYTGMWLALQAFVEHAHISAAPG